jgi:hypothetical protein
MSLTGIVGFKMSLLAVADGMSRLAPSRKPAGKRICCASQNTYPCWNLPRTNHPVTPSQTLTAISVKWL